MRWATIPKVSLVSPLMIAVTYRWLPPQAGLVDQQDPIATSATILSNPIRPRAGETHDVMPGQVVAEGLR
jgi:hypothetical protein